MYLLVNLSTNQDTLAASCYSLGYCNGYMNGEYAPHYPVPATTLNALIAVPYENIMPRVKAWLLEGNS
jgi:hypothetical protein